MVNWVQTLRAIEVGKGPRLFVRSPIQPEKVKGIHSFIIFGWSITCNTSFFGDFTYRKGDSHNLHNPFLDVFFVVPSKLRSPSISVVRGVWLGENHSEMYPLFSHLKHPPNIRKRNTQEVQIEHISWSYCLKKGTYFKSRRRFVVTRRGFSSRKSRKVVVCG